MAKNVSYLVESNNDCRIINLSSPVGELERAYMRAEHPLKIMKYCPKCGSKQFKQSGERSLKCEDCGFQFYVNASAAVAALITDESGRLMLTTRGINPGYGKLDLPGGFIDPLETAEDAVRRELMEELGLEVESLQYLYSAPNEYIFAGFMVYTLDMAFRVTAKSLNNLKPMDDILAYRFYNEDDFDYEDIPAPSIRHFVEEYFKRRL